MKNKKIIIIICLLVLLFPISFATAKSRTDVINDLCENGIDESVKKVNTSISPTVSEATNQCKDLLQSSQCTGTDESCYISTICNWKHKEYYRFCHTTARDTDRDKEIKVFCKKSLLDFSKVPTALPRTPETLIEDCTKLLIQSNCSTEKCYKDKICNDYDDPSYFRICGNNNGNLNADIIYDVCKDFDHQVEEREAQNISLDLGSLKGKKCFDELKKDTECQDINCYYNVLCSMLPEKTQDLISPCNPSAWTNTGSQYGEYTASNCYGFGEAVYYITMVIKILQIAAPILLIIWASVDLLKSVISGDEKKILETRKPVIKRFVAAALVFLVPAITSWIVDSFSVNGDEDSWLTCWKNNNFKYSSSKKLTEEDKKTSDEKYKKQCNSFCNAYDKNKDTIADCVESCTHSYSSCAGETLSELNACRQKEYYEWFNNNPFFHIDVDK